MESDESHDETVSETLAGTERAKGAGYMSA